MIKLTTLVVLWALTQSAISPGRGNQAVSSGSAPSAPTFVAGTSVAASGAFVVTTGSYTCASGNYLLIVTQSYKQAESFTVTTSTTNVISNIIPVNNNTDLSEALYATTCNGSAGTYTLTSTQGGYSVLSLVEYHKAVGTPAVDSYNTCGGGAYTASCTVTTIAASTTVLGTMATNSCAPGTPTGWTNRGATLSPGIGAYNMIIERTFTSAGATPAWTGGGGAGCSYTTDHEMIVSLK